MRRFSETDLQSDRSSPEEEMIPIDQAVAEINATQATLIAQSQAQDQRASQLAQKELVLRQKTQALALRKATLCDAEAKINATSKKLVEIARLKTAALAQEELTLNERHASLQVELQQQIAECQAREAIVSAREKLCSAREKRLTPREAAQNERDEKFQIEYNDRIAELNEAVLQFNQRVAELYEREEAFTACAAISISPISARPIDSGTVQMVRETEASVSWFQQHDLIVDDWGPSTRIYDETLKKEVVTGESKIDYLNRVIDEMPEDTSDDERTVMFRKILDNRQTGVDPLLCLKLHIALVVGQYVLDSAESSDAVPPVFFSFFKTNPKMVPKTEEMERVRILENAVLKSKDGDVIKMALRIAETIDSNAGNFSSAYQQLLVDCHQWVAEYESFLTPTPIAVELLIP